MGIWIRHRVENGWLRQNQSPFMAGFTLDGSIRPGSLYLMSAIERYTNNGLVSLQSTIHAFEYVYLARPDPSWMLSLCINVG